jgi:very-short-patch-repair endonuclease
VSFRFQWLAAPRVGVRANRQQITELMAQQHGVVSGAQLDRLGVSRSVVRTAVRHGWLALAAPGVYRSTAVAITFDHRVMVGLLALGHEAVVSHRAAAHLHEFDRSSPDVVEFTVPRGARNAKLDLPVHSTFVLPPIDRVTVGDYPCTSATRTIIDLARLRVPPPQLEAAIDSAIRTGRSSPIVLVDRLGALRGPGRWGARLLDELLVDTGGHTMLERRFLQLVRRAGLPRPQTQVIHRRDSRTFARVDFLFEDTGVVVEVSGRKGHSSPTERAHDAQRRNELQDAGRLVFEYTWEQVTQRADWVVDTLRARLARASNRDGTPA